ncbi:hypothetical protein PV328_011062 [Microctonus aethiopoides]|uniref:Uncharacterized protein n=1 Tax=Microctonus aethiopoides TaxID=144406 RepID=A0AA39EUY1_9HYME|nr:hypothetical protein PV328_011062 [Microctonus aethiopoides]
MFGVLVAVISLLLMVSGHGRTSDRCCVVRLNFKGSLSTVEPPTFTAKPSTSTLQPSTHADRSSKSAIQPSTTTSQADVSFNDEDNVTDTSSTPVDDKQRQPLSESDKEVFMKSLEKFKRFIEETETFQKMKNLETLYNHRICQKNYFNTLRDFENKPQINYYKNLQFHKEAFNEFCSFIDENDAEEFESHTNEPLNVAVLSMYHTQVLERWMNNYPGRVVTVFQIATRSPVLTRASPPVCEKAVTPSLAAVTQLASCDTSDMDQSYTCGSPIASTREMVGLKGKRNEKGKVAEKNKGPKSDRSKCAINESSSEDEDALCLFCNEMYSNNNKSERWSKCCVCSRWGDDSCAGVISDDADKPISYACKKNAIGKFQQATSEHAKFNVDMYMKVPGKDSCRFQFFDFERRECRSQKNLVSPQLRPATRCAKPTKNGMQRVTREARKKILCNKENVLRSSDDNVIACSLEIEKINETIQLNDIADDFTVVDISVSTINSQQLQQTTDEIEHASEEINFDYAF